MNYNETTNWMFAQLPMYQNKGKVAYKKDLSNTIKLASHLGNPESKFKSVHVAGTNGKGSTSHMIASILQEAGYKVGLYTSPHLKDFRERIKINGNCVSKQFVIQFIKSNKSFFESNSLSFFEMTVGMAFDYFAKKKVDIAIIEVGLGGRLDSTNIITPEVSVITNIGLDHTQFLGDTLIKIAKEKAGIIKENITVVIGETQNEIIPVFKEIAKNKNSKITFADKSIIDSFDSDLKGTYQKHNIKTAIQAVRELNKRDFKISGSNIKSGLLKIIENTKLLGRWQQLQSKPDVFCDTAHNKEGLVYVLEQLQEQEYKQLHIVLGFVKDKNLDEIIKLFQLDATYYFCQPNIPRGLEADVLLSKFEDYNYKGKAYASVNNAYKEALNKAKKEDLIFVGGSTFVVAEIL